MTVTPFKAVDTDELRHEAVNNAIERVIEADYDEVVILGAKGDDYFVHTSRLSPMEVLWILEVAKQHVMYKEE